MLADDMGTHRMPDTGALLANADWVRALARRLVSDANDADDVAQDALASTLQHPPQHGQSLPGFLRAVVTNFARRKFRDDRHRTLREHRSAREEALPSTADVIERLGTHKVVVAAVESLDEPYREAILLRYFDGLPPRAIATELHVSVKTVDTRLHRGLQILRAKLERELGEKGDGRLSALLCVPSLARGTRLGRLVELAKVAVVSTNLKVAASIVIAALCALLLWSVGHWSSLRSDAANAVLVPQRMQRPDALNQGKNEQLQRLSLGSDPSALAPTTASEDKLEMLVRVLDSREQPVSAAKLEVSEHPVVTGYLFDETDRPSEIHIADGTSNDRGECAFTLPVGRRYKVSVAAEGYVPFSDGFLETGRNKVIHVFRAASIRGHVLSKSGQTPVASAHVQYMSGMEPWRMLDVRTDAAGAFTITDVGEAKDAYVTVMADHFATARVVLDVHEGDTITRDIEVVEGHSVSGIVRDSRTKRGIGNAFVCANEYDVDFPNTKTDAGGRFRLDGIATDKIVYVRVRADGHPRAEELVQMDHGSVDDVIFDLAEPRGWHGRMVLPDGTPVADAWVSAEGFVARGSNDWQGVRTHSDGTFELTHLRADVHHLLVARKEHIGSRILHLPDIGLDAAKNDVALGDIVLLPGTLLSGEVVDEDGAPLPDVQVVARSKGRNRFALVTVDSDVDSGSDDLHSTDTDSKGRFAFADVAAGTCRLEVYKTGLASRAEKQLELHAGQACRGVRIVLPTKVAIEGRVVDAKGSPCAKADVRIEREPDGEGVGWGYADSQGRFRIGGLPPGRYSVTASPEYDDDGSFRTISASVRGVDTGTRDVLVVIPAATWIEGVVVGPDSKPVPHALVYGYDSRGVALGLTTADEHGHFRYKVAVDTATDFTAGWSQSKQDAFDVYEAIDDESTRIRELGVPAGKRDVILKLGPHP
jgi:RNA polymerase sigma factor (sigma-70 family)